MMKTLDWDAILRRSPAFEMLEPADRDALLSDDISEERIFEAGEIILRQGAIGTSVFVLGDGRADVKLERKGEEPITLYTLARGEMLGEMALIEDRPRAATVEATERTVLLEIKGAAFMGMIKTRSEIAMMLLAKLSRRLRYTDQRVMETRISGLDQTVSVMNARVDATLKTTEASLAASQTMFEQTSIRANEIIESAGRARSQLKWVGSLIMAALALLGGLGLWDVKQMRASMQTDRVEVANIRDEMKRTVDGVKAQQAELEIMAAQMQSTLNAAKRASATVQRFADRADAQMTVRILIDDMKSLKFTKDTLNRFARVADRFDRDAISKVSDSLTGFLLEGKKFHRELGGIATQQSIANPNGLLFVNYFRTLSAAGADDGSFIDLKRDLERVITLHAGQIDKPLYIGDGTRRMLKLITARHQPDADLRAKSEGRIDDVLDLMDGL